jgi:predicted AAA+ superfamily ATPase
MKVCYNDDVNTINPFNPQFGRLPQSFIGRDDIIREFAGSLDDLNDPNRTMILTGLRGSGKTSLLTDIEKQVRSKKNHSRKSNCS